MRAADIVLRGMPDLEWRHAEIASGFDGRAVQVDGDVGARQRDRDMHPLRRRQRGRRIDAPFAVRAIERDREPQRAAAGVRRQEHVMQGVAAEIENPAPGLAAVPVHPGRDGEVADGIDHIGRQAGVRAIAVQRQGRALSRHARRPRGATGQRADVSVAAAVGGSGAVALVERQAGVQPDAGDALRLVRRGRLAGWCAGRDDVVIHAICQVGVGIAQQVGDAGGNHRVGTAGGRAALDGVAGRVGAAPPRQHHLAGGGHGAQAAGRHAGGDRVAREQQRAIAQLVPGAARLRIAPAAFRRHFLRELLGIGRGQSLAVDVVVVDQRPCGPGIALRRGGERGEIEARHIIVHERDRIVGRPRLDQIALGRIFAGGQHAVVIVAIQVDALVPRHLADGGDQRDAEHVVALVASGLLRLAEVAGVDIKHHLRDRAIAQALLEVVHSVVEPRAVVAQHRDGHRGGQAAQVPVGEHGQLAEAAGQRQEHVDHHLLEGGQIGRGPAGIAAHDFRRVGQLIALQSGGQVAVPVAVGHVDAGERGAPRVQNLHGGVGGREVAVDFPLQRVQVGGHGVPLQILDVIAMHAVVAVDHRSRPWIPRVAGQVILKHQVPVIDPWRCLGADLLAHAVEVRLGVQQAGMDESAGRSAHPFGRSLRGGGGGIRAAAASCQAQRAERGESERAGAKCPSFRGEGWVGV